MSTRTDPSGRWVTFDLQQQLSLQSLDSFPGTKRLERKMSLADRVSSDELLERLNKKDIDNPTRSVLSIALQCFHKPMLTLASSRWQDVMDIADESRIHRDMQRLSGSAYFVQRTLAAFCVVHVSLSIWINELCSAYVRLSQSILPLQ